jgi:3-hydroxy-D-aspartate aldolase
MMPDNNAMKLTDPGREAARSLLDTGMKAISTELGNPQVVDPKGAKIHHLAEEHTYLVELEDPAKNQLKVGEKVEMIPSHGCTTINLHDYFYGIRAGIVESIWGIKARGRFE